MPSTLNANALCSINDLKEYFGEDGVRACSDHVHQPSTGASSGVLERAINRASAFIYGRLRRRYTQAEILASQQANHWCVVIATWNLNKTQGNPVPDAVATDYDFAMKEIAHVWDLYSSLTT